MKKYGPVSVSNKDSSIEFFYSIKRTPKQISIIPSMTSQNHEKLSVNSDLMKKYMLKKQTILEGYGYGFGYTDQKIIKLLMTGEYSLSEIVSIIKSEQPKSISFNLSSLLRSGIVSRVKKINSKTNKNVYYYQSNLDSSKECYVQALLALNEA